MEYKSMQFQDIGNGKCGLAVQQAFEKAQMIAYNRNEVVKVKLEISVAPPAPDDPEVGAVGYVVDVKEPPLKSIAHTTHLQGGRIIAAGKTMADAVQFNLFKQNATEVLEDGTIVDTETGEVME